MNFLSMKYFCAVEKERSITKAAEKLFITQQTLSAHIASIEKELGCLLFVRHTPLELTHAGAVFLGYARQFEGLTLSMEKEFADICSEGGGVLRVGIAPTRGRAIMPDLITNYRSAFPKMQVEIIEGQNSILLQRLMNGDLDLIVASIPEHAPEIESRYFYEEEVMLLVSHTLLDHVYGNRAGEVIAHVLEQRNISALSACPFLLENQGSMVGRIGDRIIAEAAFVPKISARSSNTETLLELCVQGQGACFCPEILARNTLPEQVVSSLHKIRFDRLAKYQIRLGWLRQSYCWNAISNFVRIATEEGR